MSGTGIPQQPAATSENAAHPEKRAERQLVPLDPPMLPFALGGTAVWLVALLAMLPFRAEHESWFWICVAGLLWGLPGSLTMLRHDRRRKRSTPPTETDPKRA